MILAFIPEYLADDFIALYAKITIVAFCWGLVGVAMAIDFGYGIRKAKEIGEARTSEGYRRTVKKASEYYTVMTFAFIFDALISFVTYYLPQPFPTLPIVNLVAALGLVITEYKSVREKADQKLRRRTDESFHQILKIAKDREDLLEKLYAEMAKEKDKEQNQEL